jgi:opacity protein-like surface antigen
MKKILISALLLSVMSSANAFANVYVRGSGGLAMQNDSHYNYSWDTNLPPPGVVGYKLVHGVESGDRVFKSGYLVNGAVGYDFGNYRVEGEIGYQNNGVKRFVGRMDERTDWAVWPPVSPRNEPYNNDVSNSSISESILSYMVNGYVDIDVHSATIKPYVMGGLGMASVTMHYDTPYVTSDKTTSGSFSDHVMAWQIGAGLSVKVGKRSSVELGYRYFATDKTHFNDNHYHDPNDPNPFNTGYTMNANHTVSSHHIIAGFRYSL